MKTPTATPTLIEELKTCGMRYITQDGVDVISEAAERLGEFEEEIQRIALRESEAVMQAERDAARADSNAADYSRLKKENAALKARVEELEKSMEYSDSRGDHS